MVLRIPKTIDDRTLLEDEPFKKHFSDEVSSRRAQRPKRKARPVLFQTVEEALRSEPGGLDAARAWLNAVFNCGPHVSSKDLDVFIEFYWSAFRDKGNEYEWWRTSFLLKESKDRGLDYSCPLDMCVSWDPLATEATGTPRLKGPVTLQNGTRKKTRRRRVNPPTRRKDAPFDAYEGEVEDNDSAVDIDDDQVVPKPAALVTAPDKLLCSAAPAPMPENLQCDTKGQPHTHRLASSGALSDDSPLTSFETDTEEETTVLRNDDIGTAGIEPPDIDQVPLAISRPEDAAPFIFSCARNSGSGLTDPQFEVHSHQHLPTTSRTHRPIRQASNLARLSEMMAQETEFEAKTKQRRHGPRVCEPHTITPALNIQGVSLHTQTKARRRRMVDARSPSLQLSGPVKRVKAPIQIVKAPGNSRRALAPKKPGLHAGVEPVAGRPGKKRRGNDRDVLVDAHTPHDVLPLQGGRVGYAAPLVNCPAEPRKARRTKTKRASNPPPVTVESSAEASRGRKRVREHKPVGQAGPQPMQLPIPAQERPTIQTRSRRKAVSAAIPQPAKADALVAKNPDKFELVDVVLRDSARGVQMHQNCRVAEASEWEADPDDTHLGESSEEEVPLSLSTKIRKTSFESRGPAPALSSARDPSDPPQQTQVLEVDEIDSQDVSATGLSQDIPCQLTYPDLTPCPLLEAPSINGPFVPKLPLPRLPPVWAQSRQEVCESFDWFRSYQGGVYFVKDVVKGYLLGGFSASRDLFHNGGKLIISHGGGKAAQSIGRAPGNVKASDQQEDDRSVRALLHNYRTGRPLVLIIDEKYALFPYDLGARGITYAVLGWYQIAHAWAEYQADSSSLTGRVVRWKFAFQWCDAQGSPWWSNPHATITGHSDTETRIDRSTPMVNSDKQFLPIERICEHCKLPSPQVYDAGWMCLKPKCFAFWSFKGVSEPPANLIYAASFLQPVRVETDQILEDLQPGPPVSGISQDGVTTSRHFCKGFHCAKCGRLSCRYKWEHWECRTCSHVYMVPGRLREASEFRNQKSDKMDRHTHHRSITQLPLTLFKSGQSFGSRVTFILPQRRGSIHVLFATPLINQEADIALREYQEQGANGQLKFRRWPLRSHKCKGTLLTNYFSQNTGEPYQYVGGDENTVPWDCAPSAVSRARSIIQQRIREAGLSFNPVFNEVLSAAYMEKQKMAFHSDAEKGLGPIVASLSLGAAAHMHFRLHAQYATAEMEMSESRDVLTLFLKHGDVVVMEGADIQKYYEHTVVPLNFRIAATARFIGTEHHSA